MTVSIGELRRPLKIELASDADDGAGGFIRTWVPMGAVFAKVEPRRRKESVVDGRQTGVVTHRVTIRWREDISGAARFVSGETIYRVLSVEDHDPKQRFLDCWCEEEQE